MAFSNLHVHSCYSLLDSIATVEQIVEYAVENGQSAVCISIMEICQLLF